MHSLKKHFVVTLMSFIQQVRIAILLIEAGIQTKDIAILTPYNAQVANISDSLSDNGICDITVNTIMRSQGNNIFNKCHFTSMDLDT